jgi:hypothetical protein
MCRELRSKNKTNDDVFLIILHYITGIVAKLDTKLRSTGVAL